MAKEVCLKSCSAKIDAEVLDEDVVLFQFARMVAEVCCFKKSELMEDCMATDH